MKRKSLIPILILACVGAAMGSQKNGAPAQGGASGDTASSLLGFSVGAHTFYLLKAADGKRLPKGRFLGKEAFRKATGNSADKALLVVLVPSQAKGSRLTLEVDGRKTPLEAPTLIYRMPDSPAHTYAIVDAQAPGRLTVTAPDGTKGGIDLGASTGFLDSLPHYWDSGEDGYLGYKHLPKGLYGKLPR